MRKFLLTVVSTCLFTVSLTAQPLLEAGVKAVTEASLNNSMRRAATLNIPVLPKVADTGLYSFQISKILKTRLWESFTEACSLQASIPECHAMIYGEPAYQFIAGRHQSAKSLYPDVSYLTTEKQAARYLVARNNRLFTKEFRRLNNSIWPQLDDKLPALYRAAALLPRPLDPLGWMEKQVLKKNPHILFIGEVHDFPEIQNAIRLFLLELHGLAPKRPIIILTEFLPEGYEWEAAEEVLSPKDKRYYAQHDVPRYLQEDYRFLWDDLSQYENIRVIGLEPRRVLNDTSTVRYVHEKGFISKQEMWTSLEGMRMRNEAWNKTIDHYAQANPDALIVVYTGAAHSLYNAPTSVSRGREDAFVLAFYPSHRVLVRKNDKGKEVAATTPLTDPLERLTGFTQPFPQRVLFWDNPELSQMTGFDGRIKVEVDLRDRLLRLSKFTHGRIEYPW